MLVFGEGVVYQNQRLLLLVQKQFNVVHREVLRDVFQVQVFHSTSQNRMRVHFETERVVVAQRVRNVPVWLRVWVRPGVNFATEFTFWVSLYRSRRTKTSQICVASDSSEHWTSLWKICDYSLLRIALSWLPCGHPLFGSPCPYGSLASTAFFGFYLGDKAAFATIADYPIETGEVGMNPAWGPRRES